MKKRKTYSPASKTKDSLEGFTKKERAERPHQSPRYKKPEQMYFWYCLRKGSSLQLQYYPMSKNAHFLFVSCDALI